jgi:phospholipase/carboxylesterase
MALIANVVKGSSSVRLALLVHGYGADERDLGGLLTYLDPNGELAAVLPRGPYAVPGSPGFSWYGLFGGDETEGTYASSLAELDDLLDQQSSASGSSASESIVGGFSQGAGLALGLALQRSDRARPKAALAMSPALDPAAIDIDAENALAGARATRDQRSTDSRAAVA